MKRRVHAQVSAKRTLECIWVFPFRVLRLLAVRIGVHGGDVNEVRATVSWRAGTRSADKTLTLVRFLEVLCSERRASASVFATGNH